LVIVVIVIVVVVIVDVDVAGLVVPGFSRGSIEANNPEEL